MDVVYTLATLIMWYRQHLESKKLTELLKKMQDGESADI